MALTATTTATTEVRLDPRLRQVLKAKCELHTELARRIKALETDQRALKAEIDAVFTAEGEGNALMAGVEIAGYHIKMVCGTSTHLNKKRLVELGCEPAWLAEATDTTPKKPYILITAPGEHEVNE